MTTYSIELEKDTLKVDFAKTPEGKPIPADGDQIAQDVQQRLERMINSGELKGGKLLKITGRISVVASYTLAHQVAHLYSAIAVADPRLGSYVVVQTTTPEYPFASRIDFKTGEVTEVPCPIALTEPSFFIQKEGDFLKLQINPKTDVNGDQLLRDAKAQLQQLIDSKQLQGGKQVLKISGRSTVLVSFFLAQHLAHYYSAIAVFDPKIGEIGLDCYVVAISHTKDYQVSERIDVVSETKQLVKVVLCGPPNTGKTVLREGLKKAVLKREDAPQDFYVVSGCPDGDGSWFCETAQKYPEVAAQLKAEYKRRFTPEFAEAKARDIEVIKNSLLLFDVGGQITTENHQIVSQATHAILLVKDENEAKEWQEFCQTLNLPIIAVLKSDLSATEDEIITQFPLLTGIIHKLKRDEAVETRPMVQALAKTLVNLGKG